MKRIAIVLVLLFAAGLRAEDQEQNHYGTARQADSLALDVGTPSGTMTFVIDDVTPNALVMVTSSSKTLDVSLTDPDGVTTALGATGPGITGTTTYPEDADIDPLIEGKDYVFRLEAPPVGTWTVNVTETAPLTGEVLVVTNVWMESAIQGFMVGGGEDYPAGASIALGIWMMDDIGYLTGYSVDCQVFRLMDDTFTPVSPTFADDGVSPDFAIDGMHTGAVTISEPGDYDVRATVTGTTVGGVAYERDLFTSFRVVTQSATLVPGTVTDTALDPDLDLLIDAVQIGHDVSVIDPGDYMLRVDLESTGGNSVTRTSTSTLAAGPATLTVDFRPEDLEALGEDGPYEITRVILTRLLMDDEQTQDAAYDLGFTAAYLLGDLERDPIVVNNFTQEAIDCDSDGDYDALVVGFDVDALNPGTYQYSFSLTDTDGNQIDFINSAVALGSGPVTLQFAFDAYLIAARGTDGPYSLSSALFLGPSDSLVLGEIGSTPPYLGSEFQAAPTAFPLVADFEAEVPGAIAGQSGWTQSAGADPASAVVSTTLPFEGAQGLELHNDPALAAGTSWGVFSPLVPMDDVEQVVDVELAIGDMDGPAYDLLIQSPTDGQSVAWLRFANDGDVQIYQSFGGSLAFVSTGFNWLENYGTGNYFPVRVLVNIFEPFSARVAVSIGGNPIFNGPTLGSTFVEQVVFLTDNVGPDAPLFVDNLSVTNRYMRIDCNFNGQPDACDIGQGLSQDCNGNGIPDECDISSGFVLDCNGNGVPDECDLASGASQDCNGNGIPDECDVASGLEPDCNGNLVPDDCDLAAGTSLDCNGNGLPDECDISSGFSLDCNENGVPDDCDISAGTSLDCNSNGIPDECDVSHGASEDCNSNGIPDECDLASGFSLDCNGNSIPDECDLASGFSLDCNANSIPDECDISGGFSPDCNSNGVPDECDVAAGTSPDCNTNGVPDECDISIGTSLDLNLDGRPDECEDFLRGDANESGDLDLSDAMLMLQYLVGSAPLGCGDAFDSNDDGSLNLVDPIALLSYLFSSGAPLPAPFGACGADLTTGDPFDCFGDFGGCP